ncbi:EF-P lysine aminoacylase GenX [bacterium]|nr:EF-P lysine aminoacylase GenX [bacterium]
MNKLRIHQKRSLINLIRNFFVDQGFFEIETPLLVPSPGMEVHLHGFNTNYVDQHGMIQDYYLPTSPEFAIKKALGAGFEKVFEIARVFRNNGELGSLHHPEFNMLEWYRPGDYTDIMGDVENLLGYISANFESIITHENFSWDRGIRRTSVSECFQEHAGIDLEAGLQNPGGWRQTAIESLGESIHDDDSFEDIFYRVWMKLVEPKLGQHQPEIVYDYPASMAALAKLKQPERLWAERFELYIQGVEIGNAFSELTDSQEQIRRFEQANQERKNLGYPAHPIDKDFINAVGKMKPSGGIAVGLERLAMVLIGESDIRQFFLQSFEESSGAVNRI